MQKNKEEEILQKLNDTRELMNSVILDSSVPRNIRRIVEEGKNKLETAEELGLRISSAIYMLDDISNDINMPAHTRTDIWTIISQLEELRELSKNIK